MVECLRGWKGGRGVDGGTLVGRAAIDADNGNLAVCGCIKCRLPKTVTLELQVPGLHTYVLKKKSVLWYRLTPLGALERLPGGDLFLTSRGPGLYQNDDI